MPEFKIKKQVLKTPEQAYAELLGSSSENQIVDLPIHLIKTIDNQPFQIKEDKVNRIAESMKLVDQLDPVLVLPPSKDSNEYILLAGRHRREAALRNGKTTLKAIIKKEDNPDKQRLILLASNNDRNNDYLPSELAFSYREQLELLKKLGSTKTTAQIAEDNNTNRKSVHKYIQLTYLNQSLLNRVDNGELTVGAGYELSFLPEDKQKYISLQFFNYDNLHITQEQAKQIRKNPENINEILSLRKSSDTVEEAHTEKKLSNKAEKKVSLEETPKRNKEIPKEVSNLISEILYNETYSIFKYIVTEFASSDYVIEFITARYVNNDVKYNGSCEKLNSTNYLDYGYVLTFKNNGLNVILTNREKGNEKFKITYKQLDDIIRKFLSLLPVEDIISMLKEKKNGNN